MPSLLDIAKARKELEQKDLLTIERDTALTWGGRAAASYVMCAEEEDHAEQMRCFWEAETYRAEAVEHAAMTEDSRFLERIIVELEGHRGKARLILLAAGHEFVKGNRTPKAQRGERPLSAAPKLGRKARPSPVGPPGVEHPRTRPPAHPVRAPGPAIPDIRHLVGRRRPSPSAPH